MRLLNVQTLTFQDFFEAQVPKYSILSHRWAADEVTHQDFVGGKNTDGDGYTKILAACQFAASRNQQWIWIDTCCIDKTSSAELTEAINSMFTWYQNSAECYAFLSDIQKGSDERSTFDSLWKSLWFTRGWTLQELLAPSSLLILDSSWQLIGTRSQFSRMLSSITGVPEYCLQDPRTIYERTSVAARMSWASKRRCTRSEDTAYSLLGLFNVNMPLLYGEGGYKAFFRLQLEIIKTSDDESIFCWTSSDNQPSGMFAPWPSCFHGFGNIQTMNLPPEERIPWQWTNKGLELKIADRDAIINKGGSQFLETVRFGLDRKVVTLGCFVNESQGSVDMRDQRAVERAAKGKIVCVELQRIGTRWKRVNSKQVLLAKEFERVLTSYFKNPVVHKFYYVAQ